MSQAEMTDEEIRQALVTDESEVGFGTGLCPTLQAIPNDKIRYVIAIYIIGDGAGSFTMNIGSGNLTTGGTPPSNYFKGIPVAPPAIVPLPQNAYDIHNPIISLSGATQPNIIGSVSGTTLHVTTIYYDSSV